MRKRSEPSRARQQLAAPSSRERADSLHYTTGCWRGCSRSYTGALTRSRREGGRKRDRVTIELLLWVKCWARQLEQGERESGSPAKYPTVCLSLSQVRKVSYKRTAAWGGNAGRGDPIRASERPLATRCSSLMFDVRCSSSPKRKEQKREQVYAHSLFSSEQWCTRIWADTR